MSRPKVGLVLKSVKPPKEAAADIVDSYDESSFLTRGLALRSLRKQIQKEFEDRDALVMKDVSEAIGGTC